MLFKNKTPFIKLFEKKDQTVLFLVSALYIYYIKDIVFPSNFQQDDISELRVINLIDFQCVVSQGDNHPLWTYLIWFSSKISFFRVEVIVSTLNIILLFLSIVLLSKTFIKLFGNTLAFFLLILFVSSPSLLTYSVSLKQYMIELFYSSFCIFSIFYKNNNNFQLLSSKKFIAISVLCVVGSLVNTSILFTTLLYLIFINKLKWSNYFKFSFFLLPAYPYFVRIYRKLSRESYGEYWKDFFISTTIPSELFEKFISIFNLLFKSFFGYFYFDQAVYILLLGLLISFFIPERHAQFPKLVLMVFFILNIFKLYPLGAGRTDIILFPFFLTLFGFFLKKLSTYNKIALPKVSIFVFLIYLFFSVDAFYKIESMSPLIDDLNKSIDIGSSVIVSSEQAPSFEYYSKEIFGQKIENNKECDLKTLDLVNYYILDKAEVYPEYFYKQISKATQKNSIYVIGIELPGTRGRFRDVEDYLQENSFTLVFSNIYEEGIYLNYYEK